MNFPSTTFSAECVNVIPVAVVAALLLAYPVRVQMVNPIIQIAICASLTFVGLSMAIAHFACGTECSSCSMWVMAASAVLSLTAVIMPAVGALVGLASASALIVSAFTCNLFSSTVSSIIVSLAALGGASVLFIWKEMFMHWQLIAPPVVGGYLAALACGFENPVFSCSVWAMLALASIALHIRRRKVNTWLERKQDIAVRSKESQIVGVMRSANPEMTVEDFHKLQERLLGAVDGDREQVDRIVFGGGLY